MQREKISVVGLSKFARREEEGNYVQLCAVKELSR